jgi:hypothetical protein
MVAEHIQLARGGGKGATLGVERVAEVVPRQGGGGEIGVCARAGGT